ncbi:sperm surface protein Sp17 [Athene noctua]|uniref:sperm surface protein Sp17 n=1 Tax=Athene noctua TaxID=126797 RepID=UPI003EBD509C
MSIPFSSTALRLPAGFQTLLEGLALEVLRAQPPDVVAFAAQHFRTLLERREESSADPAVRRARLEDELLTQPPFQKPEKDKEKEDKDDEEEKSGEQDFLTPRCHHLKPRRRDVSNRSQQSGRGFAWKLERGFSGAELFFPPRHVGGKMWWWKSVSGGESRVRGNQGMLREHPSSWVWGLGGLTRIGQ